MLNYLVIQGGTRMAKLLETLLREAFRDSTEYTESELREMLPQVKGEYCEGNESASASNCPVVS